MEHNQGNCMNRRRFINKAVMGAGMMAFPVGSIAKSKEILPITGGTADSFPVSIFSKNLQWLGYDAMAETAAALGFDGVDLTVRPNGHVLPERVKEDLPKACEAVRKAGLKLESIVTSIDNADEKSTIDILRTASQLQIPYYRLGWFHYRKENSIEENLSRIAESMRKIDALNEQFGLRGIYQNHSGEYYGAPLWDLARTFTEINSKRTGSQYDIYHAMIEGANSWIYGFELLKPYIWMINIKDFQWVKKNGKWQTETVPLGEGMIDFPKYFTMLKASKINCPISLHYEYPIGGAEHGASELRTDKSEVLAKMKKDLTFLRRTISEAGQ
ncbi:MAG TPA: sugar phosphate isomerase/epimerase family protein [Chryseosolibacter sp.]|nr:sugar phosphate isomerase/epimerase family protein [Chryseosolibacter sp.]